MLACLVLTGLYPNGQAQDTPAHYFALADSFLNVDNRDSAIHYAENGMAVLKERGDTSGVLYGKLNYVVGHAYAQRHRCEEAQPHFHKAIDLLKDDDESEHFLALCYLRAASCHRDYKTKIAFLEQALIIFDREADRFQAGLVCLDLGIAHWRVGNIEQMYQLTNRGLDYMQGLQDVDRYILRLEFSHGRFYAGISNTEAAVYYMKKAYDRAMATNPDDPILFTISRDLGQLLIDDMQYSQAVEVLSAPIQPDSVSKSAHRLNAEADLWYDLGHAYVGLQQYNLAEQAFLNGLEAIIPMYGERVFVAYAYIELANFYLGRNNSPESLKYLDLYLDVVETQPVEQHPDYVILNSYGADVLLKFDLPIKVLERIDDGMEGLGYDRASPFNFKEVYRYDLLAELLNKRTIILYDQWQSDKSLGAEFQQQIDLHLAFLDTVQVQILDPSAHMKILEDHFHVFEKALEITFEYYSQSQNTALLREGLTIAEKSKDQIFSRFLLQNRIRSEQDIPAELLEREAAIGRELAEIEVRIFNTPTGETTALEELNNARLAKQLELDRVITEMNQPYIHLIDDISVEEIVSSIGDWLGTNDAILEFFSGSDKDHLFIITNGRITWSAIEKSAAVEQLISALQDFNDSNGWRDAAASTYSILAPFIQGLPAEIEHLIIVPDGNWSYIPFEIFTLESESGPVFLLERFAVSYGNSMRSLINSQENTSAATRGLAAFAPDYSDLNVEPDDTAGMATYAQLVRSGEYALPGAAEEASAVSSIWNGRMFSASKATKEVFKSEANKYRILHLSMHALLEEENPNFSRLVFTPSIESGNDNYLFASELSKMNLDAEMAVLSACNTGAGKSIRGEGVMSLSRAFQYAGVPSTVHSLWKVPDAATADLMVAFYRELREGNDKAVALRNAKLEYLKGAKASELHHPYYWAGFVAHGATDPITPVSSLASRYIVLLIAAAGVILVVGWHQRKRNRARAT